MLDTLFILAPLAGLAVNVPMQLLAGRLDRRHRVLRSALVGLALGGIVCLLLTLWTMSTSVDDIWPWLADLAVNGVAYLGLGICYWNFLNLGSASIRMRIFDELDAHPDGLSKQELQHRYNDDELMQRRLQRMLTNGLIVERDGRYFVRRRWLVMLASVIRLAKLVVMGKTSQFAPRREDAVQPEEDASSPPHSSPGGSRVLRPRLDSILDWSLEKFVLCLEYVGEAVTRGRITTAAVLAVHFVVLVVCARIAFTNHQDMLLNTMDGATECCLIRLQQEWMPLAPSFGNNPFAGHGNIFAFLNTRMMPCFALSTLGGDGAPNTVAIYTICAVELFAAILILGALLGIPLGWRLFAAWSATLYTLPFVWPQKYLNLSDQDPHHIEMQAAALISIGLFYLVGRTGAWKSLLAGAASYLLVLFMAVSQPQWFIVSIPIFVVFFLTFVWWSGCRKERWSKVGAICLMVAVSLPTLLPYISGSVLNSVPAFFGAEMRQARSSILLTTILFHEDGWRYGQYLWIGSFLGALISVFSRDRVLRPLAVATLLGHLTVLTAIVVTRHVLEDYHGPPILYMEIYLWPFYFLFGCRLLMLLATAPLRRGLDAVSGAVSKLGRHPIRLTGVSPAWSFLLLLLPAVLTPRSFKSGAKEFGEWPRPTPSTKITDYLHEQIGLDSGDGSDFRGTVATFLGYSQIRQANWHTLVHADHVNVMSGCGNQHRGLGFWEHNIPTLFDYNYLVPPAFYATTSRLLTRTVDQQERNLIVFTRPNQNYLACLGVRFLVTDFVVPGLPVRCQMRNEYDSASQFVYEIEDPNLGNYSPTRVHVAADAGEAVALLQKKDFSFREEVVVFEQLPDSLAAARVGSVSLSRNGMRIQAESEGDSLLVLPLPFSRCLELTTAAGSQTAPRLLRVNLSQTGLLFSGKIDATVRYGYGPFDHPFGMLADYFELKQLGLGEIPDNRDLSPPTPIEDLALRETTGDTQRAVIESVRTFDRVPGRLASAPEEYLFDGDPATAWSSPDQSSQATEEFVLELAEVVPVKRIRWLATSGEEHIAPRTAKIQVSRDGRQWMDLDEASCTFETRGRWRCAEFPAVQAKQLKLQVSTQRHQVGFLCKIAEFVVDRESENVPTWELCWTAPRDADSTEGVYEYDVRWSAKPIQSEEDFQSARPLLDLPPKRTAAGAAQEMPLDGGKQRFREGYFAVVAVDRARNNSTISNNVTIPASSKADGPPDRMAARPPAKQP